MAFLIYQNSSNSLATSVAFLVDWLENNLKRKLFPKENLRLTSAFSKSWSWRKSVARSYWKTCLRNVFKGWPQRFKSFAVLLELLTFFRKSNFLKEKVSTWYIFPSCYPLLLKMRLDKNNPGIFTMGSKCVRHKPSKDKCVMRTWDYMDGISEEKIQQFHSFFRLQSNKLY